MNFIKKLFGITSSSKEKTTLKRTPEVQASLDRIAARKQKELKDAAEKKRREQLLKSREQLMRESDTETLSPEEHLRRLKKKSEQAHNDRLIADSGMMANSKMDLWLNSVMPEDPPDTIAPHMRIPETVFDVETNKFKK